MPIRDVDGHDIWFAETGSGPARRLMIHCSLARHEVLLPLDAMLPSARTTLFDLPGHGQSGDWTDGGDYQTVCLMAAVAALEGPAHVIGHSFGGTVALRLAVERPDLVSRLTLIEPVFFAAAEGTAARAAHDRAFAPFEAAWAARDREVAAQVFFDLWGPGKSWDSLQRGNRIDIVSRIHTIPATEPAILQDVHGVLPRLGEITVPVDLIEGAHSPGVIAAILDRLEADIPDTRRRIIEGAGHMAPLTHPAAVASAIAG